MLPPFTPFHLGLYRKGAHFTPGRFFPLAYLYASLEALAAQADGGAPGGIAGCAEMATEALLAEVRLRTGVDYDAVHAAE